MVLQSHSPSTHHLCPELAEGRPFVCFVLRAVEDHLKSEEGRDDQQVTHRGRHEVRRKREGGGEGGRREREGGREGGRTKLNHLHSQDFGACLWFTQFEALLFNLLQKLPVLHTGVGCATESHNLPDQNPVTPKEGKEKTETEEPVEEGNTAHNVTTFPQLNAWAFII